MKRGVILYRGSGAEARRYLESDRSRYAQRISGLPNVAPEVIANLEFQVFNGSRVDDERDGSWRFGSVYVSHHVPTGKQRECMCVVRGLTWPFYEDVRVDSDSSP